MRVPPLILSALVSLAAAAGPALAAEPGQGGPPHHGPLGGGALFISPMGQPFRSAPGEPYPVAAWFAQADRNKDGAIDADEFRADATAFFRTLDVDGDGVIAGPEVARYETVIAPEISRGARFSLLDRPAVVIRAQWEQSGGMGNGGEVNEHPEEGGGDAFPDRNRRPGPGDDVQGAAPFDLLRQPEPVTAADADFNGRIKLAEFIAAADRRFKLLDANGDGRLTLAELPQTQAQQRLEDRPGQRRRRPS